MALVHDEVMVEYKKAQCIGQVEASTSPPPPPPAGIPRAFDTFAVPGRRELDYQNLPRGGEEGWGRGVGKLNHSLDFM